MVSRLSRPSQLYIHLPQQWSLWHHSGQAFIDFARENLDSLVEKAIAETDEAERQKLYEEIQTIAYEDALGITLYNLWKFTPEIG